MNKPVLNSGTVKELTVEEIQNQRKVNFARRYEATFNNKNAYEESLKKESEDGFALNYYGVKSNWL